VDVAPGEDQISTATAGRTGFRFKSLIRRLRHRNSKRHLSRIPTLRFKSMAKIVKKNQLSKNVKKN